MEGETLQVTKRSKKTRKALPGESGKLPRRRRRRSSLQLPKGVRVRSLLKLMNVLERQGF
jgi:hypothetical protein